jgi:hypothetical protein
MPVRAYTDFILELRDFDRSSYRVALLHPDAPPSAVVQWDADSFKDALDDLDRKSLSLSETIELGARLGNNLLPPGPLRDAWRRALRDAGIDGGVRLRLVIRAPELAQIPWEFVNVPMDDTAPPSSSDFLALNPQLSIVRHEPLPLAAPKIEPKDPLQLSVVAAFASPANMRELKLSQEKKVLEDTFAKFEGDGVTADYRFLENCTRGDLETALDRGADVFHFAGHGTFENVEVDPATGNVKGEGKLLLLKDKTTRQRDPILAADIAALLQGAGVRLAVLGACRSGGRDNTSAWSGVAPAILKSGIAAAVAMQYEVRDDAAIAFSGRFYTALAAGLSVDEAAASGRRAMWALKPDDTVEWGVPVLYMRSADGVLFSRFVERENKVADKIRLEAKGVVESIREGARFTNQEIDARNSSRDLDATAELKVGTVEKNAIVVNQKVTL